jgi:hypothetical protein
LAALVLGVIVHNVGVTVDGDGLPILRGDGLVAPDVTLRLVFSASVGIIVKNLLK